MPIILKMQLPARKSASICKTNLLPKIVWDELRAELYNKKLISNLQKKKYVKKELDLEDLTEIIRISTSQRRNKERLRKKSEWFTWKCQSARKMSLKQLRIYNKTLSGSDKKKYIQANRKYKKLCEESKKNYYDNLELRINEVNNSKDWWKMVNVLRCSVTESCLEVSPAIFMHYFQTLLNPTRCAPCIQYVANLVRDDCLDRPISIDEIRLMLQKTKCGKAPGSDKVPYEFFKNADDRFLVELANVFNRLYNMGQVSECFETSLIYPLFKKGDRKSPSNYRGISFMNCVAKIMMGILNERLTSWVENKNIITEFQAGFRKRHSTVDNIYNLAAIVHIKFREKKKVYAFFVDFKAAFDTVPRQLLLYKLHEIGISTKMANFIESYYRNTCSIVKVGDEMSEKFKISSGVKQGCLLSPLLFALYLNDLHDCLEGGLFIDELNIRLLLYADDIVILADEVSALQKMISNLEKYCDKWNMQVNLSKSAIMIFRRGGRIAEKEKWFFHGEVIPITKEYNYLGVKLTSKLSFKQHIENRNVLAKNSINATWCTFLSKNKIKLSAKWKLFLAVTRAIQSYAAQVWGNSLFEEVDKIQLYFLKRVLHLPSNTPSYCILLETNVPSFHLYTLQLHLKYIFKTLFEYDDNRLPHILSKKILEKQIFWVEEISNLAQKLNITCNWGTSNKREWNRNIISILENLHDSNIRTLWERAHQSTRLYKELDHNNARSYLNDNTGIYKIMWIMKARCDLIYLGSQRDLNCTLCNLNELEDITHFLGKCPILKRIRQRFFGKYSLNRDEIIDILNGVGPSGYNNLFKFITGAIEYRKLILSEFNT